LAYDFVFIANESSDAAFHLALANLAVTTESVTGADITALDVLNVASTAFGKGLPIPMSGKVMNVQVYNNGTYSLDGVVLYDSNSDPLEATLVRLGIRLDVRVVAYTSLNDDFTGIRIEQVPTAVPLFPTIMNSTTPRYSASTYEATPRTITLAQGEDKNGDPSGTFIESSTQSGIWEWYTSRVILPSNTFADPTNPYASTQVTILNGDDSEASLLVTTVDTDWTAPRNLYWKMDVALLSRISIYTSVAPWDDTLPDDLQDFIDTTD
jgi:hypothetical protein